VAGGGAPRGGAHPGTKGGRPTFEDQGEEPPMPEQKTVPIVAALHLLHGR
jgi:hypothetical protein